MQQIEHYTQSVIEQDKKKTIQKRKIYTHLTHIKDIEQNSSELQYANRKLTETLTNVQSTLESLKLENNRLTEISTSQTQELRTYEERVVELEQIVSTLKEKEWSFTEERLDLTPRPKLKKVDHLFSGEKSLSTSQKVSHLVHLLKKYPATLSPKKA